MIFVTISRCMVFKGAQTMKCKLGGVLRGNTIRGNRPERF